MAQINRAELKAYFLTGKRPTQDQFSDLIDSYVSHTDDAYVPVLPDATDTVKGVAEIATLSEVAAGTDNTSIVTPEGAKKAVETFAGAVAPVQSVNGETGNVIIPLPTDTGWVVVNPFLNGFLNFGAPHQDARYRKKAGVVYLEGFVKNSVTNNGTIFQLPVGCRPVKLSVFPQVLSSGGVGRIDIDANGNVLAITMDVNGTNIGGISFVVD